MPPSPLSFPALPRKKTKTTTAEINAYLEQKEVEAKTDALVIVNLIVRSRNNKQVAPPTVLATSLLLHFGGTTHEAMDLLSGYKLTMGKSSSYRIGAAAAKEYEERVLVRELPVRAKRESHILVVSDNYVVLQKHCEKRHDQSLVSSCATVTQMFRVHEDVPEYEELAKFMASKEGKRKHIFPLFDKKLVLKFLNSLKDQIESGRPYTETEIPGIDVSTLPHDVSGCDPRNEDYELDSYGGNFTKRSEVITDGDGESIQGSLLPSPLPLPISQAHENNRHRTHDIPILSAEHPQNQGHRRQQRQWRPRDHPASR